MKNNQPEGEAAEPNEPLPNSAVEDFFSKMNRDFRRPKPSEEAVAAALQAIQTLAADVAMEESNAPEPVTAPEAGSIARERPAQCPKCSGLNSQSNRFCGFCGTLLDRSTATIVTSGTSSKSSSLEQHVHHHHHHYHHFTDEPPSRAEDPSIAPSSAGLESAELTGAEAVLRKLIQRWTLAYNSQRLDEVSSLYSSEAIVLRPNTLPVRGGSGVREHLASSIESGLGDIQLDCTDIGLLGEIACLSGRSRMLMPVSAANRQERTGKFLVVARREGSEWKVLADVWCMDAIPTPPASARGSRK